MSERHYDQHPVYGDLTMRYANDRDLARLASLADDKEKEPMVEKTSVSLGARELAILRSTNWQSSGLASRAEVEALEDKLRRAALRLYDRGVR